MSYPTSLDSFTTKVDGVDYPKASHINSLQTAVEALEAKVGIDSSSEPDSIDYKISNNMWPIGSVFLSVVSTDPSILLGFGTWSQIAGGKMLVGQTASDSDFNVAEETGGAKTANLAHTHTGPSHTHTGPSHTHTVSGNTEYFDLTSDTTEDGSGESVASNDYTNHRHAVNITSAAGGTGATGAGGTGATGSGGSATQSILNPYFVVYAWKRTA